MTRSTTICKATYLGTYIYVNVVTYDLQGFHGPGIQFSLLVAQSQVGTLWPDNIPPEQSRMS